MKKVLKKKTEVTVKNESQNDQDLSNNQDISVDSGIMEVLEKYPVAAEIFMNHGLPCLGCAAARFEKISDIAGEFGIDAQELIDEILEVSKK